MNEQERIRVLDPHWWSKSLHWSFHNMIAHPLSDLLFWLAVFIFPLRRHLLRLSDYIHDASTPGYEPTNGVKTAKTPIGEDGKDEILLTLNGIEVMKSDMIDPECPTTPEIVDTINRKAGWEMIGVVDGRVEIKQPKSPSTIEIGEPKPTPRYRNRISTPNKPNGSHKG